MNSSNLAVLTTCIKEDNLSINKIKDNLSTCPNTATTSRSSIDIEDLRSVKKQIIFIPKETEKNTLYLKDFFYASQQIFSIVNSFLDNKMFSVDLLLPNYNIIKKYKHLHFFIISLDKIISKKKKSKLLLLINNFINNISLIKDKKNLSNYFYIYSNKDLSIIDIFQNKDQSIQSLLWECQLHVFNTCIDILNKNKNKKKYIASLKTNHPILESLNRIKDITKFKFYINKINVKYEEKLLETIKSELKKTNISECSFLLKESIKNLNEENKNLNNKNESKIEFKRSLSKNIINKEKMCYYNDMDTNTITDTKNQETKNNELNENLIKTLKTENKELNEKLIQLKEENKNLRETLNKENKEVENQINEMKKELAESKKSLENVNKELSKLVDEKLNIENKKLKEQLIQLNDENIKNKNLIKTLDDGNLSMIKKNIDQEKKIIDQEKKNKELTKKTNNLDTQNTKLIKERIDQNFKLNEKIKIINNLNDKNTKLNDKNTELNDKNTKLIKEIIDQNKQNKQFIDKNNEYEARIKILNKRILDEQNNNTNLINYLNNQINEMKSNKYNAIFTILILSIFFTIFFNALSLDRNKNNNQDNEFIKNNSTIYDEQ